MYKPTKGKVTVNGTIAPLIELGAGFDMDLTARENIYLNGTVLGFSPKYLDEKFDEIVEFSELQNFLDVPLKNYSSGMVARIGFAIATAMANCGAKIVFNDIKQELVDKGLAAYKEAGINAHGYVCDVTDEDAVNAMVAKITEEVGHINILVNNAGIIKRIPMIEMTAAQFRQVIDVDLNAPFIVAKAVIPDMIEQGGGKIINICSMMSELGRETVSAYAAAKGALKMLTKNIASEYGEYNIQCNGIGPGYIATPQTAPPVSYTHLRAHET